MHPEVREAAVVVAGKERGEPQLVGYVAGDPERLTPASLREHLGCWLPSHMVPSALVVSGRLPRTPAGKIHRAGLAARSVSARVSPGVRLDGVGRRTMRTAWSGL